MSDPSSLRKALAGIGALAVVLIAVSIFRLRPPPSGAFPSASSTPAAATPSSIAAAVPVHPGSAAEPPFAERILATYADPARSPEEDLRDIVRTLDNFALLVKGENPLPLGANEEIAAALRGKNRGQLRALPDDSRAFNAQGQIVDRWGSPLFFHAESRARLDIRSAGPDRVMWTADDLHRKHDGRMLRGDALLPASLFGSAKDRK